MKNTQKDIRALSREELRDFFVSQGEKAFRGNQVYEWLWVKGAHSFDDMTNISKETRAFLDEHFVINHIKVDQMQRSSDGTIKNAVKLHDNLTVESVLIPTASRTTASWRASRSSAPTRSTSSPASTASRRGSRW